MASPAHELMAVISNRSMCPDNSVSGRSFTSLRLISPDFSSKYSSVMESMMSLYTTVSAVMPFRMAG